MNVHICTPFRLDKDLGKAYNEAMQRIPDGDWACLIDYDVQLLTPDAGAILHRYASMYPKAGVLTCFTNRISPLSHMQLIDGTVNDNPDMKYHIGVAELQRERLYDVSIINRDISGFLMLVSKDVWRRHPFPELGKPLGVDTTWNRIIRSAGLKILRMDGLYVWHTYRLMNGIHDKKHLQV